MKLVSAYSTIHDETKAIFEAYQKILQQLNGQLPQLLVIHSTVTYNSVSLMKSIKEIAPSVPVYGGTSCAGIMTDKGFHSNDGKGLGLLGILDPEGAYGVGACDLSENPRLAAREASMRALEQAGRPGEIPSMVWIMSAPGCEEAVLQGIGDFFGPNVPIGGGSSADNTVSGEWKQFANSQIYNNAVVVSVLFSSTDIAFSFHSGYDPTRVKARVTKGSGRVICELDDKPAAEVYNHWLEGRISTELFHGGNILMKSSLNPLGRVVGTTRSVPYFQLSHPDRVVSDKSMTIFTDIQVGDEIYLMKGSIESLVSRAQRVVHSALRSKDLDPSQIEGALIVYCAGCMLTVKDQMPQVVESFREGLGPEIPFLGVFTFGEQGCFLGGENRHGNLMISVLIFSKRK